MDGEDEEQQEEWITMLSGRGSREEDACEVELLEVCLASEWGRKVDAEGRGKEGK